MVEPGQDASTVTKWDLAWHLFMDRPVQAPREEGICTYDSTGKMLHLFHSVINFLSGPPEEELIQVTAKAER